jgi:hypothetical protein
MPRYRYMIQFGFPSLTSESAVEVLHAPLDVGVVGSKEGKGERSRDAHSVTPRDGLTSMPDDWGFGSSSGHH